MQSVEHRKLIYAFVSKLLGRDLSVEEHEGIKKLLTAMNKDATDAAVSALARANAKLKPMGKALWHALHSKGVKPEDLVFLREALQLGDEDLAKKQQTSEAKKDPEPKHD